ncbi:sensor histidine kinase [Actinocrispum sp. NPDC049592]|uniref:sensor histidine kinase n=1 Tax=Actinocrispum sp. NPDC049592 TaxID=3154835 RepID=UPI003440551B
MHALNGLYLLTLAVAGVATLVTFPVGVDWLVAGGLVLVGVGARRSVAACGVVAGVGAALFPMFSAVAFGLLPITFVRLSRVAAVGVGVVATGLPLVVQPLLRGWFAGTGWQPGAVIRFGPAYVGIVGIALPVLTGMCTAGAVQALRRQNRRRQDLLDQLVAARAELAEATRRAERQRLAHELHDTLAQGLAGVLVQLQAAEQHLDGPGAVLVARARQSARTCLADTRRAVEALRPEQLDSGGLAEAVDQVCARFTEMTGVPARPTVRGVGRPGVDVVALRIVQEALANAGKHAGATKVVVDVDHRGDVLHVMVRDDGQGFDSTEPRAGFGLATMRERVGAVGGSLSITSAPGAGTTVTAVLPTGEDR